MCGAKKKKNGMLSESEEQAKHFENETSHLAHWLDVLDDWHIGCRTTEYTHHTIPLRTGEMECDCIM